MLPGISGLSLYLPPYRVQLQDWCAWNDQSWEKTRSVVGRSFRMRGPAQSVYTLAANAVLRLIEDYDIDPQRVGMLALGTESSSDNSAGAIIIKGMINDALDAKGMPPLARDCEVPEFKHACLAGVYGLKAALRYLSADGAGRQAIVVACVWRSWSVRFTFMRSLFCSSIHICAPPAPQQKLRSRERGGSITCPDSESTVRGSS